MPPFPDVTAELVDLAAELASSTELLSAFRDASTEPALWERAENDPHGFLRSRGVPVPEDFNIRFLREAIGMPGPGFEPFNVTLFNCRTFWQRTKDPPFCEVCRDLPRLRDHRRPLATPDRIALFLK